MRKGTAWRNVSGYPEYGLESTGRFTWRGFINSCKNLEKSENSDDCSLQIELIRDPQSAYGEWSGRPKAHSCHENGLPYIPGKRLDLV
jgi:hypothetical protein